MRWGCSVSSSFRALGSFLMAASVLAAVDLSGAVHTAAISLGGRREVYSSHIFVDIMMIRIICRISSATPARYKPPSFFGGTSRLPSTLYGSVVHPSPVNIQ